MKVLWKGNISFDIINITVKPYKKVYQTHGGTKEEPCKRYEEKSRLRAEFLYFPSLSRIKKYQVYQWQYRQRLWLYIL